jgi:hypothetical protein
VISIPAAKVNCDTVLLLQVLQQLYLADESPGSPVKLSQVRVIVVVVVSYTVYFGGLVFYLRQTAILPVIVQTITKVTNLLAGISSCPFLFVRCRLLHTGH